MRGQFCYMVSSYLRPFCMKNQTAVIPVMVNGALEGLSHMPAAVKSAMIHTQAVMGKLARTESPLLVGDCKCKSCKTHSGVPPLCCQKQNTVPAFLIGAERLLRVGGAVKGGKGIVGYDITLNKTLESYTLASGRLTQALHP